MRAGSLFSGYGGLDLAVQQVIGASPVWHCEVDPAASAVLAHHWPTVPNLGDITTVDWSQVEPVDLLDGGFPCQDLSLAGKGAGLRPGTRSGLWTNFTSAIEALHPRLVVIENVRGLLSAAAHSDLEPCPWCVGDNEGVPLRALGAVLGDLADLGYDAVWCGLRAADVGAPHGRYRIFIAAAARDTPLRGRDATPTPGRGDEPSRTVGRPGVLVAHTESVGHGDPRPSSVGGVPSATVAGDQRDVAAHSDSDPVREQPEPVAGGRCQAIAEQSRPDTSADADSPRRQGAQPAGRRDVPSRGAAPDAAGPRWEQPRRVSPGPAERAEPEEVGTAGRGGSAPVADADGDARGTQRDGQPDRPEEVHEPQRLDPAGHLLDWGGYAPAINRWATQLGRPAPHPTVIGRRGGTQLNPVFVEWLMGLDAGHVTDVPGLSRNDMLRLLGNGVVPQQAAAALRYLLPVLASSERAA